MSNLAPDDINDDELNRLLWGILVVMIKDYLKGNEHRKKQAKLWLFNDEPPGREGVNAQMACDALGLDLNSLRQVISSSGDIILPKDVIHRLHKPSKAERDKYRLRSKVRDRQTRYHQNIIRPELRSDLSHHQSPADGIPSG